MSDWPVEYISDHEAQTVALIPTYQREVTGLVSMARIIGRRAQTLEDLFWSILTQLNIDDAVGVQLDKLGKVVGEPRLGRDDDEYRDMIRVRILANRSNGEPWRLIQIAKTYADAVAVRLREYYPAAILMEVVGGDYVPVGLRKILVDSKLAGVGMFIAVTPDETAFTCGQLLSVGEDGATAGSPNPTDIFHSAAADFVSADIVIGDELRIYPPDGDAGVYTIQSVIDGQHLKLSSAVLAAGKSGASFDVARVYPDGGGFAALRSYGTNGATAGSPNPTDLFTSAGATFQSDGVVPGDTLFIVGLGLYPIITVPSETSLQIATAELPASLSARVFVVCDPTGAGILLGLI